MKAKRTFLVLIGILFLILCASVVQVRLKAQTVAPPIQIQSIIPHTSCTVTPAVTTYCFASDGLFVSLNGAAFAQVPSGGVTSITVCNAVGTSCGLPLSGPVSLNVPKTVTASVTLQ